MSRRNLLFGVLGLVLVTAVWFVLFINPKRGEISDIDTEIETAQVTAQGTRSEIAALRDIRDSELTYQVANAELLRSIPQNPELATFIDALNSLAEDTNVDIANLSQPAPGIVEGQPFQPLTFTLDAQGQFFEMLGFLYGLQDMERLVKVDSLTMSISSDSETQEVIANIRGSIFTLATSLPPPTLELPAEEPPAEEAPAEDGGAEEEAAEADADGATTDDADAAAAAEPATVGGDT